MTAMFLIVVLAITLVVFAIDTRQKRRDYMESGER